MRAHGGGSIINTASFVARLGADQADGAIVSAVMALGHALGLGHSSESSSAMYSLLDAGSSKRTLVSADLNVPDESKVRLLDRIGETDFRLTEGSSERIQIEALLAHFALIGQDLSKK